LHGVIPEAPTSEAASITYIGGPTALVEWHGLRLLTDPTFDPAGVVYELPGYKLRKTADPAIAVEDIGEVDAVLLSHEQHLDNLDHAGRSLVATVARVLTTRAGAARIGSNAVGLAPWAAVELPAPDGSRVRVVATPARHGPAEGDRGPVVGFVLQVVGELGTSIYFSGDTVFYGGVGKVIDRFDIAVALLCLGAARVAAAGNARLTFSAAEAVQVARAIPGAVIVPLHYEGWEHLSESRADIERAFHRARLEHRLRWPRPGAAMALDPTSSEFLTPRRLTGRQPK